MKKLLLSAIFSNLFITTLLISNQAYAIEGLSANVGITNNYLWRGLEQTNGNAAISGGIDYKDDAGFYLGTWASNASWAPGMTSELDFYGGYSTELANISYDIGFIYYAYLDSDVDADFSEIYASISYSVFTLGYAVLTSGNGMNFGDDSYLYADAAFDISNEIGLTLHAGTGTDEFYAGEAFIEYGASLSKNGFTFGISKTDLANTDTKVYLSYSINIEL